MNIETLHDLFVFDVQRMYGVETQLLDELEALEGNVGADALDDQRATETRERLREAIADHRAETETQVERLDGVLDALGSRPESRSTPESRSAPALEGLIAEKELFNNVVLNDRVRPLFYLWVARQVERLEITTYERLLRVGAHLDLSDEVLDPLETNLEEERAALQTLESLAESDDVESLLEGLASSEGHR